jgi:hypothetical protein
MAALALAIVLFLTVVLVVFSFGAAAYAPSSVLDSRLRALGWQRAQPQEKPASVPQKTSLAWLKYFLTRPKGRRALKRKEKWP